MFDWNQLPSSESGWKLSAMQKQKIIENCTQKRGPLFRLRFKPFLAPAVGVLATCAAVFTVLLLWPRPQGSENVVTIPGTGSEVARPDEYVAGDAPAAEAEKDPVQEAPAETLPPESTEGQTPGTGDETPGTANPLVGRDWTQVHRFWETVPEMSLEEAIAIGKDKSLRLDEPLTDRERMAIYVWVSNAYHYQINAEVEDAEKYGVLDTLYEAGSYYLQFDAWTQPGYTGNIFTDFAWSSEEYGDYTVKIVCPWGKDSSRGIWSLPLANGKAGLLIPDRFPTTMSDYGSQNLFYGGNWHDGDYTDPPGMDSSKFDCSGYYNGCTFLIVKDGEVQKPSEIPEALFQDMLRHYLSLEAVSWIGLEKQTYIPPDPIEYPDAYKSYDPEWYLP